MWNWEFSLEKRRVFNWQPKNNENFHDYKNLENWEKLTDKLESLKTKINTKEKTVDKTENIKEEINSLKNLEKKISVYRKNEMNSKLSSLYAEWWKTNPPTWEWFKNFLRWIYWVWPWEDLDISKNTLNTSWLKWPIKTICDDLAKYTWNKYNNVKTVIENYDISKIEDDWNKILTARQSTDNKTLTKAVDVFKNVDFWKILESEWWIISALIWATALYKLWWEKSFYALFWTIAWVFWINKITQWWMMDFLWESKNDFVEEMKNNKFEDEMQDQLNLVNIEELKAFKEIHKWKTKNYLSAIEDWWWFDWLTKIANWKAWDLKHCPKWISQKAYARVLIKIMADKWWFQLKTWSRYFMETWIDSESIDKSAFDKWLAKFWTVKNPKFPNMINNLTFDWKPWMYYWAHQNISNWIDFTYEEMKNSWTLDYIKTNWEDIKRLWDNSVIFKYDKNTDTVKMFSSKEKTWQESLIWEFFTWSFRMMVWWLQLTYITTWADTLFTNWETAKDIKNTSFAIKEITNIDKLNLESNINDSEETENIKKFLAKIWEKIESWEISNVSYNENKKIFESNWEEINLSYFEEKKKNNTEENKNSKEIKEDSKEKINKKIYFENNNIKTESINNWEYFVTTNKKNWKTLIYNYKNNLLFVQKDEKSPPNKFSFKNKKELEELIKKHID